MSHTWIHNEVIPERTTETGRIIEAATWFVVCSRCGCQTTENGRRRLYSRRPHGGGWTEVEPACEAMSAAMLARAQKE